MVETAEGSPFDNALKTLKYSYYGNTKYLPSYTMDYSLSHNCRIVHEPASPSKEGVASTKCVDCGYVEHTDIVNKPAKITFDASSYEYKGVAIEPKVTVTDSIGRVISADNYNVTYSNNSAPGTGKVTVTFKGEKYTGSMAANFTITLRVSKPTISSVNGATSGMTIAWNKVADATGYKLYRSVNGAAYTLVKTITSNATVSYTDTKAKTNGAKYQYKLVAYKTVSGTTYSSANSAVKTTKTVKVTSAKTVSKVLSKLKKGKTYKIQIRAYKTVSRTKYYSAWSPVKSVKITK